MGSRRVLGNDPFQRGAAERTPPTAPGPAEPAPGPISDPSASQAGRSASGSSPGVPVPRRSERPARAGGTAPKSPPTRTAAGVRPARKESPAPGAHAAPARPGTPHRAAKPPTTPQAEPPSQVPPLAASVVPDAPPSAVPPPAAPAGFERAAAASSVPGAREEAPPPPVSSAPTLTWTPLPGSAAAEPAQEQPTRRALDRGVEPRDARAGTAFLADALREAPGLLAEAWSAIEAAVRAIRAGLGTAGGEQLDVYGRDARLSEAVAPLVDFLYSRWFRVEVEGAASVPTGGALLVANHAGALPLDGPILHEALRRERPDLPEARWLAEDQVFYAPLLGTLFNRLGAVRASPDSATRLLAERRPVLIFPEGIQGIGKPFRDRYRLQRFGRGGFVKLALRTGKPILPVAIMGAEETLPLLGKLPGGVLGIPYLPVAGPLRLPAQWPIRIGEALQVPAGAKETDLSVVESMVEATRNTIEHMLRALLGARGGVFSG